MYKLFKKFQADTRGTFATILAVAIVPVLGSVGLAVDYSRISALQSRMEIASDNALLSAMKKLQDAQLANPNLSQPDSTQILKDEFVPFFEANLYSAAASNYDSYNIDFNQIDHKAEGVVTVEYNPVILHLFSSQSVNLETKFAVNLKVTPENFVFDIVMCIDATASMQNTINAAVANAQSFDADLRNELGISEDSNDVKIRTRPIFYRDYQMQNSWKSRYNTAKNAASTGSSSGGNGSDGSDITPEAQDIIDQYDSSKTYKKRYQTWIFWGRRRYHKQVHHNGDVNGWNINDYNNVKTRTFRGQTHYYFLNTAAGRADMVEAAKIWFPADVVDEEEPVISAAESLDMLVHISGEDDAPSDEWDRVSDTAVNYAESMKGYVDFIDLNPGAQDVPSGTTLAAVKSAKATEFQNFLASEEATAPGNYDYPEAAGACLDMGMRSNWWVEDSDESREFFDIPAATAINNEDAVKSEKVTAIPMVVFWTDAGFQSLNLTKQMQPTQPTSFGAFKSQWNDANIIPQDNKLLMLFGPAHLASWPTVSTWDGFVHGGTLADGNSNAIKKIADEIIKRIPDVLRVSG